MEQFFSLEVREEKIQEFINLKQGNMTVGEYSLKFTKLSKYVPFMVADPRVYMSKFMFGASNLVSKDYKTTLLVKEKDISQLMTYTKTFEEEKFRERARKSKRTQVNGRG